MRNFKVVSTKVVDGCLHAIVLTGGKVVHFCFRRRIIAAVGGVGIMLGATYMLEVHQELVGHAVWECLWFTVHAIGAIPILKPFEGMASYLLSSPVAAEAVQVAEDVV